MINIHYIYICMTFSKKKGKKCLKDYNYLMFNLELESSACVFNTTVPLKVVFNGVFFLI